MALSQIQCLDDNHVNPRTHESKAEFLYCEDQRLALEAFLRDGREAFVKYLGARGLRGFLSDPELESLAEVVEPYDPGSELFPEGAENDETPLSLHYWPELSDTSIPQMDLGWPESISYRGVTRTTVYSQPPLEGQVHIKEVVRKMIAQAQKVIAVVMDVFTDVDIFRDLLDAGFRRRVSVYILLERKTLPHFRSMCQRAEMHAGHLKHLRVRCTDGTEFNTRSCTKVKGRMGHRFMFIDGDKAVSGSYSFTWTSSRLDRNLITVVTGQAVETFDRLFRILYATSSSVDLRQDTTVSEPEQEPLPQPATVAPPSADVARKLNSPKYALVTLGNPSTSPSAGPNETQTPENSKNPETKKGKQGRASKEATQEAPPLHPGLTNLEKACMISYLPTWPEPDPPSDVIGFINIRDARKPDQVHLQRSERFETSQAIRFSSPFSMPKEALPEVPKPRQLNAKHEEMNKLQPAQDKTKAEEPMVGRAHPTQVNAEPGGIKSKAEAPGKKPPPSGPKCESDKDTTATLNTENKRHSNTPTNQDASNTIAPHLSAQTPPQSSRNTSPHNTARPSHTNLPRSTTQKEAEINSNTQNAHNLESDSTQASRCHRPTDSNIEPHSQTKTVLPHTDSHTRAVHTQTQKSSETTPNIQNPSVNGHMSSSSSATCPQHVSSTSLSEKNHASVTTNTTTSCPLSSISSSSSLPPLTASSKTPNPNLPSSSASLSLTSTPPIPKPRTVQLVINDGNGLELPEFSVVRMRESSTGPQVVHNEPAVATVVQTSSENVSETVPELQNNSGSKTDVQTNAKNTLNIGGAPQQKQSETSQETENEEADRQHDDKEGMQFITGNILEDVLITDVPKAESVDIQERIPTEVEPKTLTSVDCKLTPQMDCVTTVETDIKAPERALTEREFSELPNEKKENVTHTSAANTQGRQSNPNFTPTHRTDSVPNTAKQNTNSTSQERIPKARGSTHTPERPLRLHLSDIHVQDLLTPEKESRSLIALARTPTPDGFPPSTPTPESRTHTPDQRSFTPDFRTPTPDGYDSSRANSVLSNTSDEYYECSDSPFHESVFDRPASRNHKTTEDHGTNPHKNAPNTTTITTSAATLGTTDRNSSSSKKYSLSGVSSTSSTLEKKVKMGEEKETANEENGREEDDEKGKKAERMAEGDNQETEKRGGEEAKRTADHFKQGKDSTDTEKNNKEANPQAPKRKRLLNQSAADIPVTPGESTNERTESKPTDELQPKKASSEGKRPERVALGPSGLERRDRPLSTRETGGQKLLHTPSKASQGPQQDSGASSPSRPSKSPIAAGQAAGPRPWGSRQLNQAENKVLHDSFQVLGNTSSPHKPPSRPPPPMTAAGRKQAEVPHSQQSFLSRQPLAAQGRMRAQNPHPYPKPQASLLHTHSYRDAQPNPRSQNQRVSQQEAHLQEEGRAPFSFTFSRLYNLKGLKERMSKLPAQSKNGRASSPAQGHKSTR